MTRAPVTDEALVAWARTRRWFATGPGPGPASETAVPTIHRHLLGTTPAVDLTVLDVDGATYQLLTRPAVTAGRKRATRPSKDTSATAPGGPDVADDPDVAKALVDFVASSGRAGDGPTVRGHWLGGPPPGSTPARPVGGDQSNTSVAVGGTHMAKVLRRLRTGPHPEVEVGRHLAAVTADDPDLRLPVAALAGWWDLAPAPDDTDDGDDVTVLGVVHELVPGALDGWSLALSALGADPGGFLERLHDLGRAVARLHGALARVTPGSEKTSSFGVIPLGPGAVAATATGVETALAGQADHDALPPVLVQAVVERVRGLAADLPAETGPAIRDHGDLHLGQTVVGPDGWVVLDFEGEPARPLAERRERHSPLRDVAGLLRSLSYAAETVRRAGTSRLTEGWEAAARAAVLDGYLGTVDPSLLAPSSTTVLDLLALFELEKAVYEVGYELAHRPDWVGLPLAGLARAIGGVTR